MVSKTKLSSASCLSWRETDGESCQSISQPQLVCRTAWLQFAISVNAVRPLMVWAHDRDL